MISGGSISGAKGCAPAGGRALEGAGGNLRCPQLDAMAEVLNVSVEGGCGCHLA